jgi:23S rRNA-/tRNA-specific pseudouridylate synthase
MEHFPFDSDKGKDAQTEFHLLHKGPYLLALAFPKTGRQHQIRVHAAAHGFPLLGDKIYLGDIELFKRYKDNIATSEDYALIEIPRHALHALALHMPKWEENPVYSEKNFISPLPHDLREWIKLKMPEIDVKKLEEEMKQKVLDYFSSKITS